MDEQTINTDSDDTFTPAQREYLLRRIGELGYPSQRAAGLAAGIKQSEFSKLLHGRRPAKRVYRKTLLAVLGPSAAPAAPAAPAAGDTRVIDNHRTPLSNEQAPTLPFGDGAGRGSREPSPAGGLRPQWHRVFRQGSSGDPRRPGDGVGGGSYEVRLLASEEHDIVGREGFGVTVTNDSVANWEGGDGHVVRVGAIAWCDPTKRPDVRDGHLVVAHDPVDGLTLGIYREGDGGPFLETDEPGVPVERRPCDAAWVIGPVVWVTMLGGRPRRRARGRTVDPSEPTGHTFVAARPTSG